MIRDTPDLWREAVRTPSPILAYLVDYHASRVDVRTPEGRDRLVAAVLPTLRKVGNPTVRDSYLQLLARRSTVAERVLLEALHAPTRADPGRPGGGRMAESDHGGVRLTLEAVRAAREEVSPEEVLRAVTPVEAELLRLILLVPDQQPRVAESLDASHLAVPSTVARELYRAILEVRGLSGEAGVHADPVPFDRGRLLEGLDPETRALAIALYARPGPDPAQLPGNRIVYAVDKCLLALEEEQLKDQIAYTQAEQADAELRGDQPEMDRLLALERQYNEARRSLDRRREQIRLLTGPGSSPRPDPPLSPTTTAPHTPTGTPLTPNEVTTTGALAPGTGGAR